MSRFKTGESTRYLRGDPAADTWLGPLSAGDWIIIEGPMGYGYGYGQIEVLRPSNLSLVVDSNVGIGHGCRRDEVRDVVDSMEDAQAICECLERLRSTQPFGVFNQRHYAGRYHDLRRQAQLLPLGDE